MTPVDDLWDFDDPSASEARFRVAIESAGDDGDSVAADEARTQLARSVGLQGRFAEGHEILDRLDADHPAEDRVRVRARLERGRLLRSSGDAPASVGPFAAAWELARTLGEDGLAVDAAHMLALVDAPPGEKMWHTRALDLADTSSDPNARRWRGSLWNNIGWARFDAGNFDGALAAFETALSARREQDKPRETRIAEWCIARCLRALGRPAEALAIHERLAVETAAAGETEDGYGAEETGECLLALGREAEARPHFARAAELLAADAGLAATRARADHEAQAARGGLISVPCRAPCRGSAGQMAACSRASASAVCVWGSVTGYRSSMRTRAVSDQRSTSPRCRPRYSALMSSALCPNGFRPRCRQNASATNIQSKGALRATNTGREPAGTTCAIQRSNAAIASAGSRPSRSRVARSSRWIASAALVPRQPGLGAEQQLEPPLRVVHQARPDGQQAAGVRRGTGRLDVHADPGLACQSASSSRFARRILAGTGRPGAQAADRRPSGGGEVRAMAMDGANGSADRAAALRGIVESAQRLGVELDEAEAAGWVAALEVESTGGDVVVDVDSGIFGHRVSMLDFTPGTSSDSGRSARWSASRTALRR